MEQLMGFFQGDLVRNFGYTDDQTIESLFACQAELRRAGLDLPRPAADASELPTQPFGLFVPPSVEQVIGRRTIETETELIRGRERRVAMRRDSRMSISIPPDGGPAFVESVDSPPSSSARLTRVASVDEDGDAGRANNKDGDNGRANSKDGARDRTSKSADQRRASYAKTRAVGNGPAQDQQSRSTSNEAPLTANGDARPVGGQVTARQQKASFSRRTVKPAGKDLPANSDSAAPQQYGVTVRL